RREILSLTSYISSNYLHGRCELVVRGSGIDPGETARAVDWVRRVLESPYWQTDDALRLRDVVDHQMSAISGFRQAGYEEFWDRELAHAYARQDNPLLLSTNCFLTLYFHLQRLRWQLKGGIDLCDRKQFCQFFSFLADNARGLSRAQLNRLLLDLRKVDFVFKQSSAGSGEVSALYRKAGVKANGLSPVARALTADAASDIGQNLLDIPDDSLEQDWRTVCNQLVFDISVTPQKALERLHEVRRKLLVSGGCRMFVTGSSKTIAAVQPEIDKLIGILKEAPVCPVNYGERRRVDERLQKRTGETGRPVYVGLLHPNTHQGVIMNSVPAIRYTDASEESLLRYLATQLYSGCGARSMYMKTWAAGLAYGNGLDQRPDETLQYYADKVPALPDTIRFVNAQLKSARRDSQLTEYAIAQVFWSWAAGRYESRGEAMADSLADGVTPDLVREFHRRIMKLRKREGLSDELYARMIPEYAQVLPGLSSEAKLPAGSVNFIIGDQNQFALYEDYLKSSVDASARLYRLLGRDFWLLPDKLIN
ncbi:MAG TPA: hypothetical protein V6C72_10950, partial [Chroococcales cyanobacterium]